MVDGWWQRVMIREDPHIISVAGFGMVLDTDRDLKSLHLTSSYIIIILGKAGHEKVREESGSIKKPECEMTRC